MPSCVTAVNDAPASLPKNISDTIRKCPEDEMGRNSVKPCTRPRITAWSQVIASPITHRSRLIRMGVTAHRFRVSGSRFTGATLPGPTAPRRARHVRVRIPRLEASAY